MVSIIMSPVSWGKKSDHIIYNDLGDWSVRHVFDQETLSYKYSDARTTLQLKSGRSVEFQINRRASDNRTTYILKGWIDKVIIKVGAKEFTDTQSSMHTFYGYPSTEMLNSIANTSEPIEVELITGNKKYNGFLSSDGSSSALRWIRAIK